MIDDINKKNVDSFPDVFCNRLRESCATYTLIQSILDVKYTGNTAN